MLVIQSEQYKCKLFMQDDLTLLLLPCFFSHSLSKRQTVFAFNNNNLIVENEIEKSTSAYILNRLEQFLYWVEDYAKESRYISLNNHHNLPFEMLNNYVNDVLITQKKKAESTVKQSIQALNAYYNYLYQAGFTEHSKRLFIKPKLRNDARSNTQKRTCVKYLSPELRNILYHNTDSIRDELLLKTGGELGLRSLENRGLLLNDFKIGHKKHKGLLSLFKDMQLNEGQQEFEYFLQGKYSKSKRHRGGESRVIYIHRDLLRRFKDYYELERPESTSDHFFLNYSNSSMGTPIAKSCATKVFKKVRDVVISLQAENLLPGDGQKLEEDHTYHILRHSFGTDKFYEFAQEKNIAIDDVTTTSQVYLSVACLLGHSIDSRYAPRTTRIYIRSCHIKENLAATYKAAS